MSQVQTHHRCVPAGSGRRARPSLSHDSRRHRRRALLAARRRSRETSRVTSAAKHLERAALADARAT